MVDSEFNRISIFSPSSTAGEPSPALPLDGSAERMRMPQRDRSADALRFDGSTNLDSNDILEQTSTHASISNPSTYQTRTKEQRKKGRLFFMLKSGLLYHPEESLRFLTLTSSPDSPHDMMYSFKRFIQEIRRVTPRRLIEGGYIKSGKAGYYYHSKDIDEPLKIEYCGCRTSEGYGVIHLITAGDYLPVKWLRSLWKSIHSAHHLNIQQVAGKTAEKVAGYLLSQYIAGQNCFIRGCWSKGWLYSGARKDFLDLIRGRKSQYGDEYGFKKALIEWETALLNRRSIREKLLREHHERLQVYHRRQHRRAISGSYRWLPSVSEETGTDTCQGGAYHVVLPPS